MRKRMLGFSSDFHRGKSTKSGATTYDNRKIRNLRAECIHELDEKTIPILETESKRVL